MTATEQLDLWERDRSRFAGRMDTFEVVPTWPELTKRPSDTHRQTKPERAGVAAREFGKRDDTSTTQGNHLGPK